MRTPKAFKLGGLLVVVALVTALLSATTTTRSSNGAAAAAPLAPAPAYLTLLYSRSQWVSSAGCRALPNTLSLAAVASELQRRGLTGTGSVVTRRIQETDQRCAGVPARAGGVLDASWSDIATLRDTYGWTFVSHSRTYPDLTTLTTLQQQDEVCGSLADLRAHGHQRADGLFAYPNNRYTDALQKMVASCYAYGRRYGSGLNTRSRMRAPWYQSTLSVNGGNCNTPSLRCYTYAAPRRYASPITLRDRIASLRADQWFVMQHYRFVTGSMRGQWDCSAADWRRHWTASPEEYCWNDYLSVLDRIPASVVVTDPASVAVAWGRQPVATATDVMAGQAPSRRASHLRLRR